MIIAKKTIQIPRIILKIFSQLIPENLSISKYRNKAKLIYYEKGANSACMNVRAHFIYNL